MALTSSISLLFQRRVVSPVMHLLRVGASPRRLAWSLAVGFAVGINPLLGTTTLLCLVVAFVLRLNLVASQISNHLVYPLQLALFFVFIDAGSKVFGTGGLPLGREALLRDMRHHPLATTKLLWAWEWHALVVWALVCAVVVPVLAMALRPMLDRLLVKLHSEAAV
jgi:uncharacterized protein (DUF2062 family)